MPSACLLYFSHFDVKRDLELQCWFLSIYVLYVLCVYSICCCKTNTFKQLTVRPLRNKDFWKDRKHDDSVFCLFVWEYNTTNSIDVERKKKEIIVQHLYSIVIHHSFICYWNLIFCYSHIEWTHQKNQNSEYNL